MANSTVSDSTLARFRASVVAAMPRSTAGTSENAPRNLPMGVRAPSTMTARSMPPVYRPSADPPVTLSRAETEVKRLRPGGGGDGGGRRRRRPAREERYSPPGPGPRRATATRRPLGSRQPLPAARAARSRSRLPVAPAPRPGRRCDGPPPRRPGVPPPPATARTATGATHRPGTPADPASTRPPRSGPPRHGPGALPDGDRFLQGLLGQVGSGGAQERTQVGAVPAHLAHDLESGPRLGQVQLQVGVTPPGLAAAVEPGVMTPD